MVCKQFAIALISYLNPVLCTLLLLATNAHLLFFGGGVLFSLAPLFSIVRVFNHGILYRAYLIGGVTSAGMILLHYSSHPQLGAYLVGLSFFHISEYLLTAYFKENKLSYDSFLLNHSSAYHAALVAGMIEYLIEYVNIGQDKFSYPYISYIGGAMMLLGDLARKVAMVTAAENFDHIVQSEQSEEHRLVKTGLYGLSRHPSYAGWFYWSIGTQVLLCNPVCAVGYAWASWKFFQERIEEEECYLLRFFGSEYRDYKQTVGIGIPGITGYEITPEVHQYLDNKKNK